MDWKTIYRELKTLNWVVLLTLSAGSSFLWGHPQAVGVLLGGLIIILNFSIFQHTIRKAFTLKRGKMKGKASIITKYYLRLLGLGGILYFLVGKGHIDPVGLALGLSTIYLSIVIFGIKRAVRMKKGAL